MCSRPEVALFARGEPAFPHVRRWGYTGRGEAASSTGNGDPEPSSFTAPGEADSAVLKS